MSTTINNNELGSSVRSKLNNNLATSERNAGAGVVNGCLLSAIAGGTTFDIASGAYTIKTIDVNGNPTYKEIAYAGATGITATGLGVSNFTWITLADNSVVNQYTSPPTAASLETEVLLGEIVHFSGSATITAPAIVDTRAASYKHEENLRIWKFGTQKITGGAIDATQGTGLQFQLAGGEYEGLGRFFTTPDSPNTGTSPAVLYGGVGTLSTNIVSDVTPGTYKVTAQTELQVNTKDNGDGTTSAIAGGNYINHYVYFFPGSNGLTVVQGRVEYTGQNLALNALGVEETSNFDILNQAALIGAWTVKGGTTDLTTIDAKFTPLRRTAGSISVGGGAGGGEVNTASNVGTGGVGLYKQKVGQNLEFKKVNAGSSKVTITDDTGNSEVDIDVDPSQIATSTLNNDANFTPSDPTGVTGADQITNMMSLTTAEYNAITPNASTLYVITDA